MKDLLLSWKFLIISLLLISFFETGYTQTLTVNGKIKSSLDNGPIEGASVEVLGTPKGVISDSLGNYQLENVKQNDTLRFSAVGYDSKNVFVDGKSTIDVELGSSQLEEVVLVGYGSSRKKDLTGAVESADIDDFRNMPNTNIGQSLQGTVPGLNVGQVNSAGQTPGISIRGQSTISGNSDVLIILDGIPYSGTLASLNPDDIKSIDVLKDASAKAVYGAEASNGVLLIETKEGDYESKTEVSIKSSYTVQEPTVNMRPMGREDYLDHIRDLFWDEAYLGPDYTEPNPDFDVVDKVDPVMKDDDGNLLDNDFDWWKAGTRKASIKKVDANVSGGGEKFRYLFSLGFTDQKGFIKNDNFQRKTVRLNLDSNPFDWLRLGIKSSGSFRNADGVEPNLAEIIRQSPLLKPYDEEGDLIPYPFNTIDQNPFLPYDVDDYDRGNDFFANIYAEIDIPFIEGLKYRMNFGNNYRINNHYYSSEYGAGLTGSAYKHHDTHYDYTLDNILTYDRTFGKHNIKATLLYGAREKKENFTRADAEGFTRLTLGYNKLQEAEHQYTKSSAWQEQYEYQMARAEYIYNDKYLVTGTLRRDGFSGFAKNHKYGLFPSAALGWVISEEEFFKPDFVNNLKLRAGYGVSGNRTSRYKSLATLKTRPAYIFEDEGSTAFGQQINAMGNNDLKWERTVGLNIGVDFALFKNRIDGNINYYNEITRDLLYDVSIPWITGLHSVASNVGKLENNGLEITINSVNIDRPDFKWETTLNFSINKNRIKKLITGEDLKSSGLFIGHSLGAIYNYETNGKYQIDDDDIPKGYYPGSYRIVDQNDDGKINSEDRKILGKSEPAYRFSIWNKLTYKNLSLGFLINSIQGGKDGYLGNDIRPLYGRNDNLIRYNYFENMDYWSPSNPHGYNPRSEQSPPIEPNFYKSRSFIRLQDVNLTYNFSQDLLDKTPIDQLSVFLSGKNLVTLTNWKGWDPETNQGLTINGRPVLRSYSLGVNITF